MEYRIVSHTSQGELSDLVNALITKGWVPQGGITAALNQKNDLGFVQAMVKR